MIRIWRSLVVLGCLLGAGAVVAPSSAVPTHFTMASHREPPHIPPGDYTAERLRVISIVPTGGSTAATSVTSRLQWFGRALVTSTWYSALNTAYGLGGTTGLAASYRANVAGLGAHPTDQQITAFVDATARAQHIKRAPKVKTIWVVYFHCSTSTNTASHASCGSADHESPTTLSGAATHHVFGPLDSLGLVMVSSSQWNDTAGHHSLATRNASHEVIEAATDRGGTGYRLADTRPNRPWLGGSPWTEVQGGGSTEVADQGRVYGQLVTYKYTNASAPSHDYSYDYSRAFANHAATLGGDYSRPASPVPYYSVTVPKDWYRLSTAPHSFAKVPIKGWSVKAEKSWTLTASLLSWDGSTSGGTSPCSATKSRLRGPNGKTFPLSAGPVMNNGTGAHLDVAYDSSSPDHWCLFELKSHRTGKESGGTGHPDAGGDLYHSWLVGFFTP